MPSMHKQSTAKTKKMLSSDLFIYELDSLFTHSLVEYEMLLFFISELYFELMFKGYLNSIS